jgi:hypothetical protein
MLDGNRFTFPQWLKSLGIYLGVAILIGVTVPGCLGQFLFFAWLLFGKVVINAPRD